MPTTILHGESLEEARNRRFREEAPKCPKCGSYDFVVRSVIGAVIEVCNHCAYYNEKLED